MIDAFVFQIPNESKIERINCVNNGCITVVIIFDEKNKQNISKKKYNIQNKSKP